MNIITLANIKRLVAVAFTVVTGTIAFQANTPAHAIDETNDNHHVQAPKTDDSLTETAKKNNIRLTKTVVASGSTLKKEKSIKIIPGTNQYNEAQHLLDKEAAAKKAKAEAAAKRRPLLKPRLKLLPRPRLLPLLRRRPLLPALRPALQVPVQVQAPVLQLHLLAALTPASRLPSTIPQQWLQHGLQRGCR